MRIRMTVVRPMVRPMVRPIPVRRLHTVTDTPGSGGAGSRTDAQ